MSLKYFPEPKPLQPWIEETLASPRPAWLVQDWVPAKGMTFVAGRPKHSKKSWMAMALSMMIAEGKGQAGLVVPRPAKVLFLSREGVAPPIADRFLMLERGMGFNIAALSPNFYHAFGGVLFLDDELHVKTLIAWCSSRGVELVVFDTFLRTFKGDENSAQDVQRAMRGVEALRDAGIATMLVHHVRKQPATALAGGIDPDLGLRGSSALIGAYDSMISIMDLEIEGSYDWWAMVGGKIVQYMGYRLNWDIPRGGNYAKLTLGEPISKDDLDEMREPDQEAKF